nr:cytochrome P450 [Tanacetum cinerariifolium]
MIHLNTVLSTPSLTPCFKSLRQWNKNFRLEKRLTWISIEGLPPQAWHEAAFTRIARVWREVIYQEKCSDRNNNLVSGKVCILTKNMDLINHNMPIIIDEVHTCIRIREIPGECNEFFAEEKLEDSDTEEDYNTNPNTDNEKYAHNEDEDDDDNHLFNEYVDPAFKPRVSHECELMFVHFGTECRVAKGVIYPSNGTLHGKLMDPGFLKIQVDTVDDGWDEVIVPKTTDEVKTLKDAKVLYYTLFLMLVLGRMSSNDSMSLPTSIPSLTSPTKSAPVLCQM